MNKYTFAIDFEVSITASDYEQAMEYLNNKYFNGNSETCSFVNIPVDEVSVYPNSDTVNDMTIRGEDC
tara:strand:+ start:1418 stop:1621 length:204 start_codon:yes stop_codon:yes gene_type:complete